MKKIIFRVVVFLVLVGATNVNYGNASVGCTIEPILDVSFFNKVPNFEMLKRENSEKNTNIISFHKVRKGETLWRIAKKHKVKLENVLKWNNRARGDYLIFPGDKIRICPKTKEITRKLIGVSSGKTESEEIYNARKGKIDTSEKVVDVNRIARRFGLTVKEIVEWSNRMRKNNILVFPINSKENVKKSVTNSSREMYIARENKTRSVIVKKSDDITTYAITRNKITMPIDNSFIQNRYSDKISIAPKKKAGSAAKYIMRTSKKVKRHIVRRGENVSLIAQKYGMTIGDVLAKNSFIQDDYIIHPGDTVFVTKNTKNPSRSIYNRKTYDKMSLEDKIAIFKKIGQETGVDWEILYGLCRKESSLGRDLIGDGGQSRGWFQIHKGHHPHVTYEQALDPERSTRYAANYLIELGYFRNKFNALRLYNGSLGNPITGMRARKVLKYAKEVGFKEV